MEALRRAEQRRRGRNHRALPLPGRTKTGAGRRGTAPDARLPARGRSLGAGRFDRDVERAPRPSRPSPRPTASPAQTEPGPRSGACRPPPTARFFLDRAFEPPPVRAGRAPSVPTPRESRPARLRTAGRPDRSHGPRSAATSGRPRSAPARAGTRVPRRAASTRLVPTPPTGTRRSPDSRCSAEPKRADRAQPGPAARAASMPAPPARFPEAGARHRSLARSLRGRTIEPAPTIRGRVRPAVVRRARAYRPLGASSRLAEIPWTTLGRGRRPPPAPSHSSRTYLRSARLEPGTARLVRRLAYGRFRSEPSGVGSDRPPARRSRVAVPDRHGLPRGDRRAGPRTGLELGHDPERSAVRPAGRSTPPPRHEQCGRARAARNRGGPRPARQRSHRASAVAVRRSRPDGASGRSPEPVASRRGPSRPYPSGFPAWNGHQRVGAPLRPPGARPGPGWIRSRTGGRNTRTESTGAGPPRRRVRPGSAATAVTSLPSRRPWSPTGYVARGKGRDGRERSGSRCRRSRSVRSARSPVAAPRPGRASGRVPA